LKKEEDKRKKKEKRGEGSRLQAPLPAVRAGQRINQVFYIEEDKRNKQKNTKSEKGGTRAPFLP